MVRRGVLVALVALGLLFSSVPQSVVRAAATAYAVRYTLTITGKNQADVEVQVSGADGPEVAFNAEWMGDIGFTALGAVTVTDSAGRSLPFRWTGTVGRSLQVQNGNNTAFTIRYSYDALRTVASASDVTRTKGPTYQDVVFEPGTVLFTANRVFLMPTAEPARITARVKSPEGVRVFASLPEENGEFVATRDLWGDLRYDFGKTYFTGGKPLFVLDHRTAWGDLYRYIWFDRDAASQMWLPSYGNTPWEEAEAYMARAEWFAGYLREQVMGPLPPHTVLFTDMRRAENKAVWAMSNWNFFPYMQIWQREFEGELAHHMLHAYTFHPLSQSKLSLDQPGFRRFLREGLPTYFQLTVPAALSGEERHKGKLFELWALEQRGRPFDIYAKSDLHELYNQSTMRVYLLDQYIQRVTGGARDITDFTQAMWNLVKDRRVPAEFTEADALSAFASVVGNANQDYLRQVYLQQDFPAADFTPMLPAFREYVQWMADRWFAGSPLLFLAYIDIAAAKGGTWPHYATSNMVPILRGEAMQPFWQYLQGRSGVLTQENVLAALHAATGQDHKGFFEFWSAYGFDLDSNSLRSLSNWDPSANWEGDRLPNSGAKGSLVTEHNLSGVPQEATAVLDASAPESTVLLQVTLTNPDRIPPIEEARVAVSGDDVKLWDSYQFEWRGETFVRAFFLVTTTDPERTRFPFTLTLPSALSYPSFQVFRVEDGPERDLGMLYFLPPIAPVAFDLLPGAAARQLTLPDVSLAGAKFVITDGSDTYRAPPGATVQFKGEALRVDLLDGYGFLRGRRSGSAAPAAASKPSRRRIQLWIGQTDAVVDGKMYVLDSVPYILEGRTMVPVRFVSEAMGATVDWDQSEQKVTVELDGDRLELWIGQQQVRVNGSPGTLEVPPEITGGRTMVPLRFVLERLRSQVTWNGETREVTIER